MTFDEFGRQLHDRATRGEALSIEEQSQLQAWYTAQDRAEMNDLSLTAPTKTTASLQAQIDSVLAQLTMVTRRIQELIKENETLRHEIAALHRQLAQQTSFQLV